MLTDIIARGKTSKSASAVLIAAVLLYGCSSKGEKEQATTPTVTVEVAAAQTATIQRKLDADAVLYPLQQAAIVPKITAPVKKFYVERGSHVQAGQLLAELENADLAGAAADSRGSYEQAQAAYEMAVKGSLPEEYEKAQLDVKFAKEAMDAQQKIYESRRALLEQGAIAAKDVQDALVNFTQARNQYEIAQRHLNALQSSGREQELKAAAAQLASAKGKYEGAAAQLSYSKIISPIDGVVTDRPVYPGETAPSGSPVITVMDLSRVIAKAHIQQQQAATLKVGDAATISAPNVAEAIPATVRVVSPALDPSSTTVEVWVQAANPGERLRPGTSVRLSIVTQTVPNAIVVPAASLLTGSDGATSVIVVDAKNKPHKKDVKIGIREGDRVQIAEGLVPGERVVTVGAFELYKEDPDVLEKTNVQIQAPKEKEGEDKG